VIASGCLAVLAALTACTSFRARPLDAEHRLAAFDARRLDDPGLRQFIEQSQRRRLARWPLPLWDFGQLTLVAEYYSADLAVARAELDAADAAFVTAGARPNPALAVSPTYDTTAEPGISPWTLGFTLDIPIETAGKRGYRITRAQHLANAARLQVAGAAWQVRSRVRISLVQLHSAQRAAEILARQLEMQRKAVQLLQTRLDVGEASGTDVQLVRLAADQSALQLRETQKEAAQARVGLAATLGVPEAALQGVDLSFAAIDSLPSPERVAPSRREALLNRTDVLRALAEYAASESALQLEIARQYPDIHLGPGFSHGYTASELENAVTFGVSLTLPLLNRNQGPIAEAQAHRQETAASFDAVQAGAVAQVEQAVGAYRDSVAKLETAEQLLAEQRQHMSSVQALFDSAEADRLALVQAQSELATIELARAQAVTEAQLALGQLEDATQHPVTSTRATPKDGGKDS
jgi:outer membrane protein, heavy metal efflux system